MSEEEAERHLRELGSGCFINGGRKICPKGKAVSVKKGGARRMLQAGNVTTTVVAPDTMSVSGAWVVWAAMGEEEGGYGLGS